MLEGGGGGQRSRAVAPETGSSWPIWLEASWGSDKEVGGHFPERDGKGGRQKRG